LAAVDALRVYLDQLKVRYHGVPAPRSLAVSVQGLPVFVR
jgi:hypothetical protein